MKLIYSNDEEALVNFAKGEIEAIVELLDDALCNYNYCEGLYSEFSNILERMNLDKTWKETMTYNGKETNW